MTPPQLNLELQSLDKYSFSDIQSLFSVLNKFKLGRTTGKAMNFHKTSSWALLGQLFILFALSSFTQDTLYIMASPRENQKAIRDGMTWNTKYQLTLEQAGLNYVGPLIPVIFQYHNLWLVESKDACPFRRARLNNVSVTHPLPKHAQVEPWNKESTFIFI